MTRLVRTRRKANTGALEDDDVVEMTAGVEVETALKATADGVGFEAGASEQAAPPQEIIAGAAYAETDADVVVSWLTDEAEGEGGSAAEADACAGLVMMILSSTVEIRWSSLVRSLGISQRPKTRPVGSVQSWDAVETGPPKDQNRGLVPVLGRSCSDQTIACGDGSREQA
jgi:hypothetical protein